MCLQEVDNRVFDSVLEPIFSSIGFQGVFNKKGGQVSEGVATFFRTAKLSLVNAFNYLLAEETPKNPVCADIWEVVQKKESLAKRLCDRTTACQVLLLESCSSERRLVVANTHLYFHPDADHIRLLQGAITLRLAQHIRQQEEVLLTFACNVMQNAYFPPLLQEQGKSASLIICGDFNSSPGSGVLELMTLQHIDEHNAAWNSSMY